MVHDYGEEVEEDLPQEEEIIRLDPAFFEQFTNDQLIDMRDKAVSQVLLQVSTSIITEMS